MSSSLVKFDIHIKNILKPDFKESKKSVIKFNSIKNLLEKNNTIINIDYYDYNLLSNIYHYLKSDCRIINFIKEKDRVIESRKLFPMDNIIYFNSDFNNNNLKNDIADIIIGKNIIGAYEKSKKIKEINRVLKCNGNFFLLEYVSLYKPHTGFKKYFKQDKEHEFNKVIFNFQQKMNILKNCEYEIKILGNGNFYFDSSDINSLQEFCDMLGYGEEHRQYILSNILLVIITGSLNK